MSEKDQKPLDEQAAGEILEFEDENGNVEKYEFLDVIPYKGTDYAVLLPVTENEDEAVNVYIFEIVEELDSDTDTYLGIDDQRVIDEVYRLFLEAHGDEFNLTD